MSLEKKRVELKGEYADAIGVPAGTQATVSKEHGPKELSVVFDSVMLRSDGSHIPEGQELRTTAKAWRPVV